MSRLRRERRARRRHRERLAKAAGTSRKQIKMADAIDRIIEPYVDPDTTIQTRRKLVLMCAMAWNLSVIEHRASQSDKYDLLEEARADVDRLGATVAVEEFKRLKTALFPDDHRYIADTSLKPLRTGGWYLNVTSISPEQLELETPAPKPADTTGIHGHEVAGADAVSSAPARRDPSQQSRTADPS